MAETYVAKRETKGRKDLTHPDEPAPLVVPVYDNHCHLDIDDGEDPLGLAEQLARAERAGVAGVVQASGDIESSRWAVAAAERDPRVLAAVAIHPNDAPIYAAEGRLDEALSVIDELAAHPRTRAIGETGLDYFRTGEDGHAVQRESFEAHIGMAKKHGIAMQIHDRDAHRDVLDTLARVGAPEKTVFHCFSGDADMAREAADRGYWLSFAGNVTFKNAQNLRDALAVTPRERILVGDRRAVPHTDAAPRPPERAVLGAAHDAVHGGRAGHRPRRALRPGRREHPRGLRRLRLTGSQGTPQAG